MNARFILFISIVTTILAIGSFYVGHRVITRSSWAQANRGVVWLSVALFVVLQLLGPYLYRAYPGRANNFYVHWVTYITLGLFACMFLYTLAADILVFLWKIAFRPQNPFDVERWVLIVVAAMALSSALIGFIQAVSGPKVYKVEVPLPDLPQEFRGFRIAQVSDLHVGPTIGRKYAQKVVDTVNALAPDVIALTGDFVDGSVDALRSEIAPLAALKAKHGVFFVTGNHEYYWGAQEWTEEFRRLGARVLLNEHAVIRRNGMELVIAGVTDRTATQMYPPHLPNLQKSLAAAPQNAVKVLLSHHPGQYENALRADIDLLISGHTHAGQFFPWSLVVRMAHTYFKGLNNHNGMWVYVNRGAGYYGPPLRFGVPSEVTIITLVRPQ